MAETTLDLETKFLEYEELKIQAKQIEDRLDAIKEEIREHVKEDEKINCKYGVLELKKRDNWKFTPTTTKLATDLKAKQEEEIAKGEAVSSPTYYLYYKQKKTNELE